MTFNAIRAGKRGRGANINPANRFEALHYELEDWCEPDAETRPIRTQFFRDDSQSIISYNNSPDVGFDASLNPYRGCEHGCAYCYARPTHEYLGFSAGIDFESRILVKPNAAELLAAELARPSWKPQHLALSGVTDAYQPIERKLQITRSCLRVLAEFRNPVIVITKNHLVTRDADYLGELAKVQRGAVTLSITTLDPKLARILEPRASSPSHRLDAIAKLHEAGIPVGVNVAPIIPGINEHEIPAITDGGGEGGSTVRLLHHRSASADGRTGFCRLAGDPFSGTERKGFKSNSLDAEREIEQPGFRRSDARRRADGGTDSSNVSKSAAAGQV